MLSNTAFQLIALQRARSGLFYDFPIERAYVWRLMRNSLGGTLFEGRFRAKPIQTTGHLLHLCRYIHGNPVKDGLVAHPADWDYSNYLEWSGERNGTLVDREFIHEQFGTSEAYRKFLLQYLQTRNLPEDVLKFLEDLER